METGKTCKTVCFIKKWRTGDRCGQLSGSFTIEAALLVPLVLAVIFLILQSVIYLHDTVWAEAWMYQNVWKLRLSQETGTDLYGETAGALWEGETEAGDVTGQAPRLAVLRCEEAYVSAEGQKCRAQAVFRVCLLPDFVVRIFTGQSEYVSGQVSERAMDVCGFLRIAGAVLEEERK